MNCTGKIAICLAGGLVLNTSLRADDVLLPGNPYAPVVVRNIFGLNPPLPVDPNATAVEPPVKITPNGIMSIFGQLQVLFKIGGKPPGKDSYILAEGQMQDEITVTKIDEKAGIVTFNNHGIEQKLPLVAGTASSTSAPSPSAAFGNSARPGTASGGNGGANGFANTFGNRGGNFPGRNRNPGGSGNNSSGGNNSGAYDDSNLRSVPTRSGDNPYQQVPMAPEEQAVMIEANRLLTQEQVNKGEMPPLPPTPATPPEATAADGAPLVSSPGK